LTGYIDYREKEKAAAKHSRSGHSTAMQAEIDRRLLLNQQKQMAEAQARQRQMLEMQQQQQQQMQASLMQNAYAYGGTQYAPSVMGMSAGSPSIMGMPTGPGTPMDAVGVAYSSPQQFPQQMYQQQGYFPQAVMTPNTNMMPGGWGAPSPQGQYFPQQQQQQMHYGQPQQPATQPYGASFDQAQAAAAARQQRR
jgi:CCR4-NOT transcriptional complex subunit CAF120